MRNLGKGRAGAVTLSAYLNMPEPIDRDQWRSHEVSMTESVGRGLFTQDN